MLLAHWKTVFRMLEDSGSDTCHQTIVPRGLEGTDVRPRPRIDRVPPFTRVTLRASRRVSLASSRRFSDASRPLLLASSTAASSALLTATHLTNEHGVRRNETARGETKANSMRNNPDYYTIQVAMEWRKTQHACRSRYRPTASISTHKIAAGRSGDNRHMGMNKRTDSTQYHLIGLNVEVDCRFAKMQRAHACACGILHIYQTHVIQFCIFAEYTQVAA